MERMLSTSCSLLLFVVVLCCCLLFAMQDALLHAPDSARLEKLLHTNEWIQVMAKKGAPW
jgi:hypothetical protein